MYWIFRGHSFSVESDSFRTASLDALDAIEERCNLIFDRETRLASMGNRISPPDPTPSARTHIDLQPSRTSARSTRPRGLARPPPAPPKRLLFLRNTSTNPPEIAKLACSVCSRSDFSNLQGLLNHCRLRHQLEFGSHDECVRSCALLVPEEEQAWVAANGIELRGISLPSLRRLFELAVGVGDNALPQPANQPPPVSIKIEVPKVPCSSPHEGLPQAEPGQPASHVTRTLGFHVDTPALAPFLGRAPKKRCVHVHGNEDDLIDIEDTSNGSGLHQANVWKKPYVHRNVARKELDEIIPLSELPTNAVPGPLPDEQSTRQRSPRMQMLAGTRFHIAARVGVADYSLFIPPSMCIFPVHCALSFLIMCLRRSSVD